MLSINSFDSQQSQQPPVMAQKLLRPPLQWMAFPHYPHPPASMVMPHHLMMAQHYPSHFISYYPPPPQLRQNQRPHSGSSAENKTIWIGDLCHWMDENYLHSCFASTGELVSIKVIRNKQTGLSEGYGFVEFNSHETAEKVLLDYASILMPNTEHPFHLNWASFSMGDNRRSDNSSDLSIFVGDLAADVTDTLLHEIFATKYPSVKAAKVVIDSNTGRSKGYGFVRFGDDTEKSQAVTEMNGVFCSTRPMRIGVATPRKSSGFQPSFLPQGLNCSNRGYGQWFQSDEDSTNTTIFVGGLDSSVTDEDLRPPFSVYGEIVSIKIPVGKGCGFVQYANRDNAEEALRKLNESVIGKQTVRLSWGRNPANKQSPRGCDSAFQWSGGVGAYYGGYRYALPMPPRLHDPSFAAMAYGSLSYVR